MECRPPRWTAAAAARRRPPGRDAPSPDGHGCEDDDSDGANNNLGGGVRAAGTSSANDTTVLVDELEQLRTDNFQLRLRVYNAERRVDRLSAAASRSSDRSSGSSGDSDSDDDSDSDGDGEDDARAAAASAKATAEAAVRTVHDLLTVNRRLLALLAAAVSAKAVAVTGRDKRRWQKLRNRLRDCGGAGARIEEEPENSDGGSDATSSADSETRAAEATTRRRTPPRTPEEPDRAAAADGDDDDDDELARLRARCRSLERSLQQLVNTELWARNRQIGKLEQQRYGTQARCPQADRPRPVAVPDAAGRTPVDKSLTPPPPDALSAKDAIATPPPVLPDYSEVNFFYSCDDDDDDQENGSGTNATGLSSTGEEEKTATDDDGPVKPRTETTAVGRFRTPLATSTPPAVVRPRKRPKRRRIRDAATPPSSVTAACDPSDDGRATSPPRRHRIVAYRRRRRGQARRCSTCGDVVDRDGGGRVDAQVQCGDAEELDDPQVGLLRRELEARRRENGRLYDMLLRLQRSEAVSPVRLPGDDDDDDDDDDSPEPYRRAARAVRGRIADLLPPLLSTARPDDGRCAAPTPTPRDRRDADDDEQQTPLRQQQQQLLLLARLRERIVAYERQELHGGPLNAATADLPATADLQENAVERMDRAALVNVALPRAVDRLRRALVPLLQHKRQRDASPRRVETAVAAELE